MKAEPLHNTNNAWQKWFIFLLTVAMSMTNQKCLKAADSVSSLPKLAVLSLFLTHLKETVKCDRLHKNICNWFSEKRKKGLGFSYRFTGKNLTHNIMLNTWENKLAEGGGVFIGASWAPKSNFAQRLYFAWQRC